MPTNSTTPELNDEALKEIEAEIAKRNDATAMESACGEYNCPCHYRLPVLCQTVRAAWARIAQLTAQWCQCGHAKDKHGFFSDHDECYECDQMSPDLCCEWRPAPRTSDDTHAALREQLAQVEKERERYQTALESIADTAVALEDPVALKKIARKGLQP